MGGGCVRRRAACAAPGGDDAPCQGAPAAPASWPGRRGCFGGAAHATLDGGDATSPRSPGTVGRGTGSTAAAGGAAAVRGGNSGVPQLFTLGGSGVVGGGVRPTAPAAGCAARAATVDVLPLVVLLIAGDAVRAGLALADSGAYGAQLAMGAAQGTGLALSGVAALPSAHSWRGEAGGAGPPPSVERSRGPGGGVRGTATPSSASSGSEGGSGGGDGGGGGDSRVAGAGDGLVFGALPGMPGHGCGDAAAAGSTACDASIALPCAGD